MSKRRVHLHNPGEVDPFLELEDVLPEEGTPTSGYVANGDWYWSRVEGVEYAKDHNGFVRNQWAAREYEVREQAPMRAPDYSDDEIPY